MPAGFQCVNESGTLQIDGAYKNLSLLRSGAVIPFLDTNTGAGVNGYIAEVTYSPSASEIIAVQGDGIFAPYYSKPGVQAYRTRSSAPFKYYVFGVRSDSAGYGIQVYNPPNLVFDSSWKPFNVAGVIAVGDHGFASGRSYAVIFLSQSTGSSGSVVAENPFFWLFQRQYGGGGAHIKTTGVEVLSVTMWQVQQEGEYPNQPPDQYFYTNGSPTSVMVLDVTGY